MADTTTRQARVYEVMDGSLIWNLKVQQCWEGWKRPVEG